MKSSYTAKLRDPRWQKKRLQVFERDEFFCCHCQDGSKELHAHHLSYAPGKEPWDYPLSNFITLCCDCHHELTVVLKKIQLATGDGRKAVAFKRLLALLEGEHWNTITGILIVLAKEPSRIEKIWDEIK